MGAAHTPAWDPCIPSFPFKLLPADATCSAPLSPDLGICQGHLILTPFLSLQQGLSRSHGAGGWSGEGWQWSGAGWVEGTSQQAPPATSILELKGTSDS